MGDETCFSCAAAPRPRFNPDTGAPQPSVHPWVAVIQRAHLADGRVPLVEATSERGRDFVSVPCCDRCHQEPSRHAGLKAHFFPRAMAKIATVAAGTDSGVVSV
jgi:hypothetical protein